MDPVEARLRAAVELRQLTIGMRRQGLLREYPEESATQIAARLREWVLHSEPPRAPAARVEPRR
jgi:hypothetical protein